MPTRTTIPLKEYEDHWSTDLGAWFPGERVVFRGKDLLSELSQLPWMGLWLFGITGRIPNEKQIRLFEGIWSIASSFPDPRLWNNRIAALAGTARSTEALALASATCVSEAIVYGHGPNFAAAKFLHDVKQRLDQGMQLEDVIDSYLHSETTAKSGSGKNRKVAKIPGFGRPIVSGDERIPHLLRLAEQLELHNGTYLCIALRIEAILLPKNNKLGMNIAGFIAGLCLDQGLTPRQVYQYLLLCFSAGILPCALDALNKKAGTFFPLPCSRLKYSGKPRRHW